jgi:ribonuclease BN (tRNA processing enzyme)
MHLQSIGCGDAFGSGGRLNTCFHVKGNSVDCLIDIGASSLIGLKARHIARNDIQAIFVTHFHADHFGGIPFFILDAQFFSRRTQKLTVVGPTGLAKWYERVMETAFPGASGTKPKFEVQLVELHAGMCATVGGIGIEAFQAIHGDPGGPFLMYRLTAEGRTVTYTGDTEWTEDLVVAGRDADLLVAEAYFYDKKVKWHLNLESLRMNIERIHPKRTILTHMSDDMLSRIEELPFEGACDGLVVEFGNV